MGWDRYYTSTPISLTVFRKVKHIIKILSLALITLGAILVLGANLQIAILGFVGLVWGITIFMFYERR